MAASEKANAATGDEDKIILSRTVLVIPCQLGRVTEPECVNKISTEVEVIINSKHTSDLKYSYQVTGGKVVGNGKKITWDLEGFRPETYIISVEVTGKKGFRKTLSRQITLSECASCGCQLFECPEISVQSSAENAIEGDEISFTANVRGGSQTFVKYKWEISNGEIISGQDTSQIKVNTKNQAGKSIKAIVKIGGDISEDCLRVSEKTVFVSAK